MSLSFQILASDGLARRGRLTTPHGVIETPAFMPVGTLGAVKGVTPQELEAAGASIMLSNLYHLALRPGIEVVERLGGLHAFTGWPGPILTDSGGFQVWSLGGLRTVDAGGVTFRSHLDGSPLRFTPENVVANASAAINAALKEKAVIEGLAGSALVAHGSTPAEMERSQKEEHTRWGPIVRKIGFTAES